MPGKVLTRNLRPVRSAGADARLDFPDSNDRTSSPDGSDVRLSESTPGSDSDDHSSSEQITPGKDVEREIDMEQRVSQIAFGTLKQAQDTYSRKRKRETNGVHDDEQKLAALKERLQKLREEKNRDTRQAEDDNGGRRDQSLRGSHKRGADSLANKSADDSDDSDSDSAPSEEGAPSKARASKHAPMALSSRRQVTRKRIVVDVPKRITRDPRFDAFSRGATHPGNADKAYSFLRDYEKSEIAELQAAIKRTKSEEEKETLRRKMVSMQNRIKAKENVEREQAVLRQHRKEEREKVAQGKTPFYLKDKDVKERALVEKFKSMKGKDREKLVQRRRKKEGQKEKKRMPQARRSAA